MNKQPLNRSIKKQSMLHDFKQSDILSTTRRASFGLTKDPVF